MKNISKLRLCYFSIFCILLAIEVVIALFVRDRFIRPYVGDALVTVLLCAMVRIIFPSHFKSLPFFVFLFSATVEILQYFNFVTLLGLENSTFFSNLLGMTFSPIDILCYGFGCVAFWAVEKIARKN